MYNANVRRTWHIHVDEGKYVSLEFLHFDVFEDPLEPCTRDNVELVDQDYIGDLKSLGKYEVNNVNSVKCFTYLNH